MLKKIIFSAVLALTAASAIAAQTNDYAKTEFYVGYSNSQIDINSSGDNSFQSILAGRRSYNGFEGAAVYNVNRYFGVKADFSGTYKNRRESAQAVIGQNAGATITFDSKQSFYNVLGGIQVKDNAAKTKIKPFAHVLVGVGNQRFKAENLACTGTGGCPRFTTDLSRTGFSAAIGGGLDIKLTNKIDLRAIQIDYNPLVLDGNTQHNIRIGVGLVFK
jgi:opacity protein-like surface antigen